MAGLLDPNVNWTALKQLADAGLDKTAIQQLAAKPQLVSGASSPAPYSLAAPKYNQATGSYERTGPVYMQGYDTNNVGDTTANRQSFADFLNQSPNVNANMSSFVQGAPTQPTGLLEPGPNTIGPENQWQPQWTPEWTPEWQPQEQTQEPASPYASTYTDSRGRTIGVLPDGGHVAITNEAGNTFMNEFTGSTTNLLENRDSGGRTTTPMLQDWWTQGNQAYRNDPSAFRAWAVENPEMATRWYALAGTSGQNMVGPDGKPISKKELEQELYGILGEAGVDPKENGRVFTTNYRTVDDANSEWKGGDFWKMGNYNTLSNNGPFSKIINNPLTQVAAAALAPYTAGLSVAGLEALRVASGNKDFSVVDTVVSLLPAGMSYLEAANAASQLPEGAISLTDATKAGFDSVEAAERARDAATIVTNAANDGFDITAGLESAIMEAKNIEDWRPNTEGGYRPPSQVGTLENPNNILNTSDTPGDITQLPGLPPGPDGAAPTNTGSQQSSQQQPQQGDLNGPPAAGTTVRPNTIQGPKENEEIWRHTNPDGTVVASDGMDVWEVEGETTASNQNNPGYGGLLGGILAGIGNPGGTNTSNNGGTWAGGANNGVEAGTGEQQPGTGNEPGTGTGETNTGVDDSTGTGEQGQGNYTGLLALLLGLGLGGGGSGLFGNNGGNGNGIDTNNETNVPPVVPPTNGGNTGTANPYAQDMSTNYNPVEFGSKPQKQLFNINGPKLQAPMVKPANNAGQDTWEQWLKKYFAKGGTEAGLLNMIAGPTATKGSGLI